MPHHDVLGVYLLLRPSRGGGDGPHVVTEGLMVSTLNRSVPEPLDPGFVPASAGDPALDVPGRLANRITELWASEERRMRRERTDRLMREAEQLTQD